MSRNIILVLMMEGRKELNDVHVLEGHSQLTQYPEIL
jgi:hypothetical protein